MKEDNFTVIGLGLIGGSIGARLRLGGARVCGYDSSPQHRRIALESGLVDATAGSIEAAVRQASAVIMATPVLSIIELLPKIDREAPDGALILDTGSTKSAVVTAMASLPGAERAVGGHPLAGDDASGPGAACAGLFAGTRFLLCPSNRASGSALAMAMRVVERLGASPLVVEADAHDRVLARTSHLPQFLSTVLASSLEPDDGDFAGPGLRDMMRLAGSDPTMWSGIAQSNASNIVSALREYGRRIDQLADQLESGDSDAVEGLLRQGVQVARGMSSPVAA